MKLVLFALSAMVTAFCLHSYADAPAVTNSSANTAILSTAGAPAPTATVTATPAPAPTSPISGGLIACVLSCVLCLNIALTAVQKIFAAIGKNEPGPLVTLSKVVLSVATWASANPDVAAKTTPPTT